MPLAAVGQLQDKVTPVTQLPAAVQLRNALGTGGSAASARELDERPFPSTATESTFSLRDAAPSQEVETVPAREVVDPRPMLRSVASRRQCSADLLVSLPTDDRCELVNVVAPVRVRSSFDSQRDDSSRASRIAQRIAQRYPNALQPC